MLSAQGVLSPNISICMQVTGCVAGVRVSPGIADAASLLPADLVASCISRTRSKAQQSTCSSPIPCAGYLPNQPPDEHADGLRFRQPGNVTPAFTFASADLQTGAHAWGARPHDLRTVIQSPVAQSAPCPGYRCRPADGLCAPAQPPYELLQACGRAQSSSWPSSMRCSALCSTMRAARCSSSRRGSCWTPSRGSASGGSTSRCPC